ncbi:MAG: carboxylating nicotinate-nucleotide diphosphorylase [Methyloligellaceae bacterium]
MNSFDYSLPEFMIDEAVKMALKEDLGHAGDLSTNSVIPEQTMAECVFNARQSGVVSGIRFAELAFRALTSDVQFEISKPDGTAVMPGDEIARIRTTGRAILTGERVALNFLGHLSGIASLTNLYVREIEGASARICCTRKTTPGLRAFEKYAVRCGGGINHRFGLNDAVMIKDNHIAIAGGITQAVERARAGVGHNVKIEVEVDTLEQLEELLTCKADIVLLDNMGPDLLKEAVAMIDGRLVTEASGGVTLNTVKAIAETGVDLISVGALTHSASVLDIGLDFATTNT